MTGIPQAIEAFFVFAQKFMKIIPPWLERLKKEYYKLREECISEWSKPVGSGNRDDKKCMELSSKMFEFEKTFWKELETNSSEESK